MKKTLPQLGEQNQPSPARSAFSDTDTRLALLQASLSAAVPIAIHEATLRPLSDVFAETQKLAQIIAEKGDVILYKSKKRGESAKAFAALARAIAACSFAPGGIRIFGLHFESTHPDQRTAQARSTESTT